VILELKRVKGPTNTNFSANMSIKMETDVFWDVMPK